MTQTPDQQTTPAETQRLGIHLVLNVHRDREALIAGDIATQINLSTDEVEMPGYLRTILGSHVDADHCIEAVWVGPVVPETETDARRVFEREGARPWHLASWQLAFRS